MVPIALENSLSVLHKVECRVSLQPSISLLGIYSMKVYHFTKVCIQMQYSISHNQQIGKQPRYQPAEELRDEEWMLSAKEE